MALPVTIENDALRMDVWPSLGGKVSSLVDKADGFELLFNYPAELPTGPSYDVPYANGWYAGWDECFPALAPGKYVGHPYDGIAVPDHGELWGLPTTAVPTKDGITVVWQGLRFGYRLTRKLFLDGPTVRAEYTLINLAPFDFRFAWTPHALLSMESPIEIAIENNARGRHAPEFWLRHDAAGNENQQRFDWPHAGEDASFNLSHPDSLPAGRGWKAFSVDDINTNNSIEAVARIRYPARGRSLTVSYDAGDEPGREGPLAYWAVWVNTGGWAGHRHCLVCPSISTYDQLGSAISDGSAGWVGASGRAQWAFSMTVGA